MSYADNKRYLQKLVDQLKPIPRAAAVRVSVNVFMEMLAISTNDDSGFDSGQAAANWRIQGYVGSPAYEPQTMLWGYGDINPIAPVGFKSYYPGMKAGEGGRGEVGDPNKVYEYMFEYATLQAAQMPAEITGIVVYNPITPGFAGFAPGDDTHYEQNALGENQAKLAMVVSKAIARGLSEVKQQFPALRK